MFVGKFMLKHEIKYVSNDFLNDMSFFFFQTAEALMVIGEPPFYAIFYVSWMKSNWQKFDRMLEYDWILYWKDVLVEKKDLLLRLPKAYWRLKL